MVYRRVVHKAKAMALSAASGAPDNTSKHKEGIDGALSALPDSASLHRTKGVKNPIAAAAMFAGAQRAAFEPHGTPPCREGRP